MAKFRFTIVSWPTCAERRLDGDRAGLRRARPRRTTFLPRRIDHAAQRFEKPLAVGVLADEFAVDVVNAVDGADQPRGLAQLVEVLDHGDLVAAS